MATVVGDTEIYVNYFLAAFKNPKNGKVQTLEMFDGHPLDIALLYDIMNNHRVVTFNGINFDYPIIAYALAGATCAQIKEMADSIILGNMRPWITCRKYGIDIPRKWDHVDLIEVAPLMASLKIYNGRLHGKRMQDLPYHPSAILTREEMEVTKLYCVNDLDATALLAKALDEPLTLREQMGKENGLDVRSKSDAQVAEAVIKYQIEQATGEKPEKPSLRDDYDFQYQVPDFIRFDNADLQSVVQHLRTHRFVVNGNGSVVEPDFLKGARIQIGNSVYRLGLGGLHSSEERTYFKSNREYVLIDRDVESYYPRIILNQRLFPKHLGQVFLRVYEGIVTRRVAAKKRLGEIFDERPTAGANYLPMLDAEAETMKTVSESLKISINGLFGKLGSPYSVVYAPDLLIQVTLSGQLCLLMLIEAIERIGIRVVSGNTDGIVIYCPRAREDELLAAIKAWEAMTAFKTEETRYDAIYNRDVNNYIAIKAGGKPPKGKGAFFNPWSDPKKPDWRGIMSKNPQNSICIDAVMKRLQFGTPISTTIRACKDIRQFVTVRTVKGGAVQDGEHLGKAIRWYYGHTSTGAIHYASNGNKVPKSDGAVPIMELPDQLPRDIDYGWYEEEAVSMLVDLGVVADIDNKNFLQTFYRKAVAGLKR